MNLEKVKALLALAWQFLRHLSTRYIRDGCRESAAALTYMSLFAVVPLLTLMFSMFSMVPAFQELGEEVQDLIFSHFIPESGFEIQSYLLEFSSQARRLSIPGALILIVTAYLMLTNIEKTFNRIWDATGSRRGLPAFLLYWGVLSFGPLLVGIGLMMHTYLISFRLIVDEVAALGLLALVLEYLPWLLTWTAFTLLFLAMPNCRVVTRYAVIGGLMTTVLFEVAKMLFGNVVANTSFHSIYGAFAIIPLFLLWVYLCWMIVLTGAELVRSLETFRVAHRGYRVPNLMATVLVCWECWRRQQLGGKIGDRDILRLGIDQEHWLKLRRLLLDHHILERTASNHYVLTRDISRVTLWQLAEMFGDNFARLPDDSAGKQLKQYDWYPRLEAVVGAAGESASDTLSVTLETLFKQQDVEGDREN